VPDTIQWSRNTGKYRIQRDLCAIAEPLRVLDIGAVGFEVGSLDLWKPLPLDRMPLEVTAVDPDARGIARAKALGLRIELLQVNGYELADAFGADAFDLAVTTQVIEHVARPVDFLSQIAAVLKPDGCLWGTLDSAHFARSHHGDPLWKRAGRPIAARISERRYDFGLTEPALRDVLDAAGLRLDELLHCCLGPVKPMVSRLTAEDASAAMEHWYELERRLAPVAEPRDFRAIYFAATAA
jgi:SAM-dependent methyltransferase